MNGSGDVTYFNTRDTGRDSDSDGVNPIKHLLTYLLTFLCTHLQERYFRDQWHRPCPQDILDCCGSVPSQNDCNIIPKPKVWM